MGSRYASVYASSRYFTNRKNWSYKWKPSQKLRTRKNITPKMKKTEPKIWKLIKKYSVNRFWRRNKKEFFEKYTKKLFLSSTKGSTDKKRYEIRSLNCKSVMWWLGCFQTVIQILAFKNNIYSRLEMILDTSISKATSAYYQPKRSLKDNTKRHRNCVCVDFDQISLVIILL